MLNRVLQQVNTVAIGGHIRPDGDCIGSCTGLYLYIKNQYPHIKVDVYLEPIPECFSMLEVVKEVKNKIGDDEQYDLFIALDCAMKNRLGFSETLFDKAKDTLCIDHHISNPGFARQNHIVPEASSTAELVYRLMEPEAINLEIAESLYVGIVHDTGVFQYSCTAPETMEAAADLMRRKVRASELIDKTYYEKTYMQNLILGKALQDSSLILDGKCIVSYITRKVMNYYRVKASDMEGIVSQLRNTQGVEVAVFMYELRPREYKISLRASGDVNVSKVAEIFGGGGHVKAAGAIGIGKPEEIIDALAAEIGKQL